MRFNVKGKPNEGHGERASLKNNTCGSSSPISDEKEEKSNSLGQGTDYKPSTGKNSFSNSLEIFYSFVRRQAWTKFHPPPSERTNETAKTYRPRDDLGPYCGAANGLAIIPVGLCQKSWHRPAKSFQDGIRSEQDRPLRGHKDCGHFSR